MSTRQNKTLITSALMLFFSISFLGFSIAQESTEENQPVNSQTIQHGPGFVDENGDGYNDNAPDHDGDGIPNGLDPDYIGPKNRGGKVGQGFVDLDGDGINDNRVSGKGYRSGKGRGGYGPGNGAGNQGAGPRDGSGMGAKTGVCDGTGSKGRGNRGPK